MEKLSISTWEALRGIDLCPSNLHDKKKEAHTVHVMEEILQYI